MEVNLESCLLPTYPVHVVERSVLPCAISNAGTFLYVAYMEVIPKELRDPSNMALKLTALLTGFCLMSLLAVWA